MLWSDLPAEQVAEEGGFRLPRAASWRLHALSPGPPPPSHSFYSSKVCPPDTLLLAATAPLCLRLFRVLAVWVLEQGTQQSHKTVSEDTTACVP